MNTCAAVHGLHRLGLAGLGLLALGACSIPAPDATIARTPAVGTDTPPSIGTPEDPTSSGAVTPATAGAAGTSWRSAGFGAPPAQYTPQELFSKNHGDFMLRHEPWRPKVQGSLFDMRNAELHNRTGDFDLQHAKVNAHDRWVVDPNTYLHGGAQFEHRKYVFNTPPNQGAHDESLYRTSLTLGFGHFLETDIGKVLLEVDFDPGIYSDFSGTLNHADWQFFGQAVGTWQYQDNVFVKAGIEVSKLFRDLDAYPVAGGAWVIDNTWRIDVLLPRYAKVQYTVDENLSVDFGFDLQGAEYSIRAPDGTSRRVNVQELLMSLRGQYRFTKNISAYGRIGTPLLGDYHFRSNRIAPVSGRSYSGTLQPQLFLEVGVGWDF
ncbi:MAG: hypothetical protein KDC87_08775 [Planctomycetes bacterium]|nr:hypothetical protein [Planctomycetota bacterium]MCB9871832.1 hypothetical protein [Planctomycetota bacterium]